MNWKYLVGGVITLIAVGFAVWFIFFRPAGQAVIATAGNSLFGNAQNRPIPTITTGSTSANEQSFVYTPDAQKKIFKISDGPITNALFVQTANPTTTVVRYVRQDSGHVFEQPLDAPGTAARILSNTTIPGIANAVWTEGSNAIVLQYVEGETIKTVSVQFQTTTSSSTSPAPIVHFLPDNISGIAAAPDGMHITYLLPTSGGSDGYIARYDGANASKLFSIPLSQLRISWPSRNELLLQTKTAAGVPGMAFSVSTKTGVYSALLYTTGLSATANGNFSTIVYQTDTNGKRETYDHEVATGRDVALSGQPIPEKCAWSYVVRAALICAVPNSMVPVNYLDLWHMGAASVADTIVGYNFDTHNDVAITTPGGSDGGQSADIASLSVSPDGNYVLYIAKGERSLWGVRLNQ